MNKLLRLASFVLIAAMLFAFAACTEASKPAAADPTQEAAAPVGTETADGDPTEATEPTAAPSEDGYDPDGENEPPTTTNDPNAAAKYEEEYRLLKEAFAAVQATDFETCAEKVMSLAPNSPGPVCTIEEGNGYRYFTSAPSVLFVDSGKIYISDLDPQGGLFVYDMTSGAAARAANVSNPLGRPMAVVDGKLYTSHSVEDLSGGVIAEFDPCVSESAETNGFCFMSAYDGTVRMYIWEPQSGPGSYTCTFDAAQNKWSDMEAFGPLSVPFGLEWVQLHGFGPDGSCCQIVWPDENGEPNANPCIVHTDESGKLLSYTQLPYTAAELNTSDSGPGICYAPDGSIYLMVCMLDEIAVWRINLD